eukprot:c13635_g1_i1.p1 GENE.c13635_g1_i1~~c13635_g1_i1.p1  ORF type:complete len:369 (-),score=78.59 c13635_g1_i1:163-1224(-)
MAEFLKQVAGNLVVPQPYLNDHETLSTSMLGLDGIIFVTFFLSFVHALISRSFSTVLALAALALAVEQLSIQLGETHCHADALVMISKCSSLNSILFYVFWIYLTLTTVQALNLCTLGKIGAAGFIQAMLGLCYELQGPSFNWWQYSSKNVADAFDERLFGLPLMGVYFHMAFGSGFVLSLYLVGAKHLSQSNIFRLFFAIILTPAISMLYDGPVRGLKYLGVSRFASVPCLAIVLFALPFLLSKQQQPTQPANKIRAPHFYYLIVLQFHAYFLAAPFWIPATTPVTPDLYAVVATTCIVSLAIHFKAAFPCCCEPICVASTPKQTKPVSTKTEVKPVSSKSEVKPVETKKKK